MSNGEFKFKALPLFNVLETAMVDGGRSECLRVFFRWSGCLGKNNQVDSVSQRKYGPEPWLMGRAMTSGTS